MQKKVVGKKSPLGEEQSVFKKSDILNRGKGYQENQREGFGYQRKKLYGRVNWSAVIAAEREN